MAAWLKSVVWSWAGDRQGSQEELGGKAEVSWDWGPSVLRGKKTAVQNSFCHQNGLWKVSVLEENIEQLWRVNNLFFLEPWCSMDVLMVSSAQKKLSLSHGQGRVRWLAGMGTHCCQSGRHLPGTFPLPRGNFHCICIPVLAVWVQNSLRARNSSGWFYFPKIFGHKPSSYVTTQESLEPLVLTVTQNNPKGCKWV